MINSIVIFYLSAIFLAFLMFCCFNIIFSVLSFAPWVPSRSRDLARIFKLADLRSGQTFYDLGCGDGKVVFYAGSHYKVKAIGLEIAWPLFLICRLKQLLFRGRAKIDFKYKNLYKENLSSADVVYFFGIPKSLNQKFFDKLKSELKPGTKIISYAFRLADWTPRLIDKPTANDLPIYLYQA